MIRRDVVNRLIVPVQGKIYPRDIDWGHPTTLRIDSYHHVLMLDIEGSNPLPDGAIFRSDTKGTLVNRISRAVLLMALMDGEGATLKIRNSGELYFDVKIPVARTRCACFDYLTGEDPVRKLFDRLDLAEDWEGWNALLTLPEVLLQEVEDCDKVAMAEESRARFAHIYKDPELRELAKEAGLSTSDAT